MLLSGNSGPRWSVTACIWEGELSMHKPIEVKALPNYRLWIAYSDGVQGIVDLGRLVGRGVFRLWEDPKALDQVYIGPEGQIAWSDEIDLCPDALYIEITGKTPEELFSKLKTETTYA
jgi:hypothetical protein